MFGYIYSMRDGAIVDAGTFVELRQHSVLFQEMWLRQSGTLNRLREEVEAIA